MDQDIILNIRWSVLGIIHTVLGVSFFWIVQTQTDVVSESNDGEVRCIYKAVKKTKAFLRCMEALAIHTSSPNSTLGRPHTLYLYC